jgi:hypothetical protein
MAQIRAPFEPQLSIRFRRGSHISRRLRQFSQLVDDHLRRRCRNQLLDRVAIEHARPRDLRSQRRQFLGAALRAREPRHFVPLSQQFHDDRPPDRPDRSCHKNFHFPYAPATSDNLSSQRPHIPPTSRESFAAASPDAIRRTWPKNAPTSLDMATQCSHNADNT